MSPPFPLGEIPLLARLGSVLNAGPGVEKNLVHPLKAEFKCLKRTVLECMLPRSLARRDLRAGR